MAQMLTTVSPDMTEEFEFKLVKPLYDMFGLLYYGCCEKMEKKICLVRKYLPNVRKISVSPFADTVACIEALNGDYVCSLKSTPANITGDFNEPAVRKQMETALEACKKNGTPLEIILKDVSTLAYDVKKIDRWEKIAMGYVLK
jgi:hypothetical protein